MKKLLRHSLIIGISGAVLCIILFVSNLSYKVFSPLVNSLVNESNSAYKLLDHIAFYLPVYLMVLFILLAIIGPIAYNIMTERSIVRETITNHEKNAKTISTLKTERDWIVRNMRNNCPNCGAACPDHQTHCAYCGFDLEIHDD